MGIAGEMGILIQGITGREARMVAEHTVTYGSPLVAGVTPGKAGEIVAGAPVFNSVADALTETAAAIDTSLISVPPAAVLAAGLEALDAGLRHIVIATENVPRHDVARLLAAAGKRDATLVGPNSVGVISPAAKRKVGAIGGENPERAFMPGNVGIISRSGGMTSEIGLTLRLSGIGVSTAVSIGGDELVGTPTSGAVAWLQSDVNTRVVCVFGEPGTEFEEELARDIASGLTTVPVVALIAGLFSETLPEGTAFGHAAAMIAGGSGRPSVKRSLLADAGATVVDTLDELAAEVASILAKG